MQFTLSKKAYSARVACFPASAALISLRYPNLGFLTGGWACAWPWEWLCVGPGWGLFSWWLNIGDVLLGGLPGPLTMLFPDPIPQLLFRFGFFTEVWSLLTFLLLCGKNVSVKKTSKPSHNILPNFYYSKGWKILRHGLHAYPMMSAILVHKVRHSRLGSWVIGCIR